MTQESKNRDVLTVITKNTREQVMEKLTIEPLAQLALVGGAVAIAMTTLVIYFDFRGSIDIQIGLQGVRLTIDNRQLVNRTEPPKMQVSEKK